jgi:hypothetical protein
MLSILMRQECEILTNYFSCSGGTGTDSTKNTSGHFTPNLCFYIRHLMGPASHVVHFGASGARNVEALFFMIRWDRCGFHKKCTMTCYAEHVFSIWWDLWVT